AKSNTAHRTDGTVPPCGALGSIVFVPGIVEETVKHYYENTPELWSEYGFLDAYNLDRNWVSDRVIGIDKGITLLMIENYRSGMIWELTMGSQFIKTGLQRLGFSQR
ncbi:MAG: glucoamylase family protein, partial [Mesotoga sp.]|nr:glucoamylase family protein [Mesotoga sp.]